MERPHEYTLVKHDGRPGWKLPYPFGCMPSGGKVVAIDPQGVSRLVSRKSITKY